MDTELKKKVVLVIEDDTPLRTALFDTMVREGFRVFVAPDGEKGLALALAEHPDLILLDLLMPQMDGIEMAKRLRKDAWGKGAKVLVLTNADDLTYVNKALDEHLLDYLIKSDTPLDELVTKIRSMV